MEKTGEQVVAGSKGAEQGAKVAEAIGCNCCTSWCISSGELRYIEIPGIYLYYYSLHISARWWMVSRAIVVVYTRYILIL